MIDIFMITTYNIIGIILVHKMKCLYNGVFFIVSQGTTNRPGR